MVTFSTKELNAIFLCLQWTLDWLEDVAVKDGDLSVSEHSLKDSIEDALEKILESGAFNDTDLDA